MMPVTAVLMVFALVFAAIAWLRLIWVCFCDGPLAGLLALFIPPLALLLFLPRWHEEKEMYQLFGAACTFLMLVWALQ